ncbi:ComF family protein [Agitococcus lubricus]|uniref:ComF family protein n=1 Tax=Agitococcus lubricus TaxID=1077255 RepID=A0A2T5IWA5_9GAMM|nr:ComF family protein [Agitococcus lubricus]PTQ88209.1 ComF family protein [Agitococcus lubricus]
MRLFFNQLLFPRTRCVVCQYHFADKYGFCRGCFYDLPHIKHSCLQCGLPLYPDSACACRAEDWPFSHCVSACHYSFPVDALISQFKNQHQLAFNDCFSHLLVQRLQRLGIPLPEVLIPVPAHAEKLRQRGFNQSVELAKSLAKTLHLPIDSHSIDVVGKNLAQKKLNKQQRLDNMSQHFTLSSPLHYTHVALIDDVMTTGATTKALAYVLREHGVRQIQVWTIARTPDKQGH